jgi:membrane associated rhomboid family serine protease
VALGEARSVKFEAVEGPRGTFELRGGSAIQLQSDGVVHPRTPRSDVAIFTPYEEITHLACSRRALWLGTSSSVYVLPRRAFVDPHAPEKTSRAIVAILENRAGGRAQLDRMAEIEAGVANPRPLYATWGLAFACLAVFVLEWVLGPGIHDVGYFSLPLFQDGDYWRVITGNLLHGLPELPLHLILNLLALSALGHLVERVMGSLRTICVMTISAIAAMLSGGLQASQELVGVSGVVFGLAGAVLWLEFTFTDRLPAWMRIPRRTMFTLLLFNALLPVLFPFISGAAHLGGFLGGLLAAALLSQPEMGRRSAPLSVRALALLSVAVSLLGVGAAGWDLFGRGDFDARFNARLSRLPDISPFDLNNRAWTIAIDPGSSDAEIEAALMMAERAVTETASAFPSMLDTLAELRFLRGDRALALEAIEEAIARDPTESYYQEQRRRFLGERKPDDRPEAPSPWRQQQPTEDPVPMEPGLTV